MLLRLAEPEDLDDLLDVQQEGAQRALAHIFPQDTHPFPRDLIFARWVAEIADPGIEVYVIEREGRVSGFAATRGDELLHFGTAADTWGTGLAAAAHDDILKRLSAAGVTLARLRVFEENHRAIRFYEKLGWQRTPARTRTSFPPYPVLVGYERRC
ncbi:GNAT family N-acetyltransferase [Catellatospora sichuanensis]|uniref:GNAT family N-acetyltransferase n=1 Tax=Catellatospora sichuanensis TaxID=1969805 RepID=UPI001182E3FA|nr:GNAT family N-acetyltransferase [Catellatospora sichuanensis]